MNKYFLYFISTVFGILIGFSRVYLPVHFATDVIGSFFVAGGWVALIYLLFILMYKNDLHGIGEGYSENSDLYEGNYDAYN